MAGSDGGKSKRVEEGGRSYGTVDEGNQSTLDPGFGMHLARVLTTLAEIPSEMRNVSGVFEEANENLKKVLESMEKLGGIGQSLLQAMEMTSKVKQRNELEDDPGQEDKVTVTGKEMQLQNDRGPKPEEMTPKVNEGEKNDMDDGPGKATLDKEKVQQNDPAPEAVMMMAMDGEKLVAMDEKFVASSDDKAQDVGKKKMNQGHGKVGPSPKKRRRRWKSCPRPKTTTEAEFAKIFSNFKPEEAPTQPKADKTKVVPLNHKEKPKTLLQKLMEEGTLDMGHFNRTLEVRPRDTTALDALLSQDTARRSGSRSPSVKVDADQVSPQQKEPEVAKMNPFKGPKLPPRPPNFPPFPTKPRDDPADQRKLFRIRALQEGVPKAKPVFPEPEPQQVPSTGYRRIMMPPDLIPIPKRFLKRHQDETQNGDGNFGN